MTVGKKDGSKRIVNDFRFLNEIMCPLNFTIPRTSDIFKSYQALITYLLQIFLKDYFNAL